MGKVRRNQDNRVLWVLLGILGVCFLVIGILFYRYFYAGTSSSKYGERLDGIENYPLSKTLEKDIQDLYKDNTEIDKVTVNNEGKIVYITINFTKSIKVTTAEDLAIKSLDKVGEKNLTYYDVQYILTYSGTEENTNFPVFGSKSASSLKVVW